MFSRKYATKQKVSNEAEVINVFDEFGFKEINFEDYSFYEQVYLMKNCKVLARRSWSWICKYLLPI